MSFDPLISNHHATAPPTKKQPRKIVMKNSATAKLRRAASASTIPRKFGVLPKMTIGKKVNGMNKIPTVCDNNDGKCALIIDDVALILYKGPSERNINDLEAIFISAVHSADFARLRSIFAFIERNIFTEESSIDWLRFVAQIKHRINEMCVEAHGIIVLR